ncbi:MAG TPA: AMP-binding protein, partial [Terrimicrobiaceae bacterium]
MTNLSSMGTGVAQVDEFPERSLIGPIDAGLHRRFELHALRRPSAIAVVDGSIRFTYRQINDAANRLAHYLKDLGVGREVMVGVCLERSHELIVAILAVLKAGGAYVPLDPDYPAERLGFVLRDSAVAVVITRGGLPDHLGVSAECRIVSLADDRGLIGRYAAEDLKVEVEADGLLYVIYTSGSTGQPKGVMVTHRNVVR